jgi:hypothetical protein
MPAHALVCGDGVLDTVLGEGCDLARLNGTPGVAATPPVSFLPSDTVCRPSVGVCDVQETCTGADAECPADVGAADTDLDGVCDALDDCPNASDPRRPTRTTTASATRATSARTTCRLSRTGAT